MTASTPPALPFRDLLVPFAKRIDALPRRLTTAEKGAFLHPYAPTVERLGIAAFRTGQEGLHGVARTDPATVFPQAAGLGARCNGVHTRSARRPPRLPAGAMPAHNLNNHLRTYTLLTPDPPVSAHAPSRSMHSYTGDPSNGRDIPTFRYPQAT